jgi:hypothetical protein
MKMPVVPGEQWGLFKKRKERFNNQIKLAAHLIEYVKIIELPTHLFTWRHHRFHCIMMIEELWKGAKEP